MVNNVNVHKGATREKQLIARSLRKQMTPAEEVLWKEIRKEKCSGASFRRQQVIRGFIVDFYCATHKLAIEVDGSVHAKQVAYDEKRSKVLKEAGITVMRVTNEDVLNNLGQIVEEIAGRLAELKE